MRGDVGSHNNNWLSSVRAYVNERRRPLEVEHERLVAELEKVERELRTAVEIVRAIDDHEQTLDCTPD